MCVVQLLCCLFVYLTEVVVLSKQCDRKPENRNNLKATTTTMNKDMTFFFKYQ